MNNLDLEFSEFELKTTKVKCSILKTISSEKTMEAMKKNYGIPMKNQ